ncbi:lipopolysaccharide biosynthesis protein [Parafrankia sp. BMG5.11]|uniref:lipopolysaccharide biosynthesis protein n=1 Tax=Parafrankia sp. BMG5.11 TaxID=222540 RepID=UPI00103C99C9|nr:oligosaccharide flippase family protein [Parafrankia sp. BMG5.11]TCJ39566.1 hypothetical protein E0504_10720 [Parafrankia sp. BMG5.11]
MIVRLSGLPSVRNIAKMMFGTGLAQIVTFLATPLLARLYGPDSFGQQSALLSIVGPMAALTTMAYPVAIVIARTDRDAAAFARLALLGSIAFSILGTALLFVEDMWLMRKLGLAELQALVLLIPALVILTTMNMSAGYMFVRGEQFGVYARAQVVASGVGTAAKLALGFLAPGTLSLIAGNALSYLVAPITLMRTTRRSGQATRLTVGELKNVVWSYRDFPLLRAPQNFISAVSQAVPVIALTSSFGPAAAGHYAVALSLTGAPVMLLGNAVQSVLYPKLTQAAQDGDNTSRLLLRSTLVLLALGAAFFVPIAAFGPWFFALLLGPEWTEAGVYAALLVPVLWTGLANRPAVALIPAINLQGGLLIYEILGTAAKIAAVYVGLWVIGSARWTVGLFSAAGAVAYVLLVLWVYLSNCAIERKSK